MSRAAHFAALLAAAALAAMPDLGQQRAIHATPGSPARRSEPAPRRMTGADIDRLHAAAAKRERRAVRNLKNGGAL